MCKIYIFEYDSESAYTEENFSRWVYITFFYFYNHN